MRKLIYLLPVFIFLLSFNADAQISGTPTVCVGGNTALTGSPGGGVWNSSNMSVATVGLTSGLVHGVSGGTVTISYTVGMTVYMMVVVVNTIPSAGTITGPATVCIGTTTTLAPSVGGGVWSASNGNATVSGGIVSGVTAGVDTISYTVTNACGSGTTMHVMTVNPLPVAGTITGATNVCVSATTTLTASAGGGAWSASNANATVTGGVVTGVSAGVDTIMYSVTNTCGTDVAMKEVTVDPLTTAGTITGAASVCVSGTTTLTASVGGGVWSASNANATVAGGVVTGVAVGVDTINYTVTGVCGSATITYVMNILTTPTAGTITGASVVCEMASITLATTGIGGAWSVSNGNATVTGGVVAGVTMGVDTIMYTVTNICGTDVATKEVTVNALPDAGTITGPGNVCSGSFVTLATTGMMGGAWTSDDITIAHVDSMGDVMGMMAGTVNITYAVVNSCGADTATMPVTVEEPAATIFGPSVVCQFSLITLTDATPGGTWSSSAPLTAFVVGGTVFGGITVGTATITYTVTNSCGTTEATHDVTVISCPLSTQSVTMQEGLSVYPDPNYGTFDVKLNAADNVPVSVTVTNMVGEVVKEIRTTTNKTTEVRLDVAAGIYFVTATTANGKYVAKMVVQ